MPTFQVKCFNCNERYTAFIYSTPKIGLSLGDYPCPKCQSTKKGIFKNQEEKIKEVEGFTSVKEVISQKELKLKGRS